VLDATVGVDPDPHPTLQLVALAEVVEQVDRIGTGEVEIGPVEHPSLLE